MIKLLLACLLTLSLHLTPCLAGDVCELGGVRLRRDILAARSIIDIILLALLSLQAVIQLSSSNHTYKAVPSDPNVLLHNSTQHVQLSLASPQDACQPLADPVTGNQAYNYQGGTDDHNRPHLQFRCLVRRSCCASSERLMSFCHQSRECSACKGSSSIGHKQR